MEKDTSVYMSFLNTKIKLQPHLKSVRACIIFAPPLPSSTYRLCVQNDTRWCVCRDGEGDWKLTHLIFRCRNVSIIDIFPLIPLLCVRTPHTPSNFSSVIDDISVQRGRDDGPSPFLLLGDFVKDFTKTVVFAQYLPPCSFEFLCTPL